MRLVPEIVAASLVAGLALSARGEAPTSRCLPTVQLEGSGELVEPVANLLREHGVAVDGAVECMTVLARLRNVDGQLELKLADVEGRSARRVIRDVETAAVLIETWAQSELTAPTFRGAQSSEGKLSRAPSLPASAPTVAAEQRASAAPLRAYSLGLWMGSAYAGDQTVWGDIALTGCGELGPMCLGGMVRAALDFGEHGASRSFDMDRSSVDAHATLELPLLRGRRWLLNPGFGMGVGVVQTSVDSDDVPGLKGIRRAEASLQIAANALLGVRVTRKVSVCMRVAMEVTPLGRTNVDSNDAGVEIAGMPRWYARAALGLRYERF